MATHDISDGSGGLDASIRLELDRAEVCGIGNLFAGHHNHITVAEYWRRV